MKHILLLLWSNKASVRNFLFGFCKYARTRKDWVLDLRQEADLGHPAIMKQIRDGAYDGIVTKESAFLAHPELADIEKTALVLNATYDPSRRKAGDNLVYVQHDNRVTGHFAAAYLAKLGAFASYAYVPSFPPEPWSEARGLGFAEFLGKRGVACRIHDGAKPMAEFLRGLPKPAAVFAACDRVALGVLEVCRSLKLDVPGKVAVLGVDNDEIICEFARPSLTTVIHHPESSLGEKAGAAMNELLRGRKFQRPGLVEFNQLKVIERESCAHLPQATHIAQSAMEFIRKNARRAVTVGDVVGHLGVSRRLADRQFRQTHGESILAAITRCRLEEVARHLVMSKLPVKRIAALCGFTDLSYLGKLFRRRCGISMREYRSGHALSAKAPPSSEFDWRGRANCGIVSSEPKRKGKRP